MGLALPLTAGRRFNALPVMIVTFCLLWSSAFAAAKLTPQYSYNLMQNFRPHENYRADIRAMRQPVEVLVGADDEAFHAEKFAGVFAEAGRVVPVTIVPGVGHIALTLDTAAVAAIVAAVSEHAGEVALS